MKIEKTHPYDYRIAAVVVLFLTVFLFSDPNGRIHTESSPTELICQQLDLSSSHLVSVDCDVIVNPAPGNKKSPNMAVFSFDPISINRASFELLQTVKGVGPKLAQQIITYRAQVGPFMDQQSIEQLAGVGEKRAQYLATQFSFN